MRVAEDTSAYRWILNREELKMKMRPIAFALAFFLLTFTGAEAAPQKPFVPVPLKNKFGPFAVFDALLYKGKPDLGLARIAVIYSSALWHSDDPNNPPRDKPIESIVRSIARTLSSDIFVCLDIEHWPVRGEKQVVNESIRKFIQVIQWMRDENPKLKIGIYGVLPIKSYWDVVPYKHNMNDVELRRRFEEWQKANERLKELAEHVDAVFPDIYAHYTELEDWKIYATANMEEARTYGKPVYAFVWPQYHEEKPELAGKYLPADYWRLILETCFKEANGIVIWGGPGQDWDPEFPWWKETQKWWSETASAA